MTAGINTLNHTYGRHKSRFSIFGIGHRPDNTKMHHELLQVIRALKDRDQEALVELCADHVQRFVAIVRNHFRIY